MTTIGRLHDHLVEARGLECRCKDWGPKRCPAMAAAKRQHDRDNGDQLRIGDQPTVPDTYNQLPDDF